MDDQPKPDRADRAYLRWLASQSPDAGPVSDEDLVRAAWICARTGGDGAALNCLGGIARGMPADRLRLLLHIVREADIASSTPARSSREFVWRHPGLFALVYDKPGERHPIRDDASARILRILRRVTRGRS